MISRRSPLTRGWEPPQLSRDGCWSSRIVGEKNDQGRVRTVAQLWVDREGRVHVMPRDALDRPGAAHAIAACLACELYEPRP